jgi:hypothetical protein
MAFLDALMGALCQASSGALRELAGRLVGLWLTWSHKHMVSSSKGEVGCSSKGGVGCSRKSGVGCKGSVG